MTRRRGIRVRPLLNALVTSVVSSACAASINVATGDTAGTWAWPAVVALTIIMGVRSWQQEVEPKRHTNNCGRDSYTQKSDTPQKDPDRETRGIFDDPDLQVSRVSQPNIDGPLSSATERDHTLLMKPIVNWDPINLGVHRPIGGGGRLPAFFERDHDRHLKDIISDTGSSTFVIITGQSSVGKTRSAYEAVTNHRHASPLFFPQNLNRLAEFSYSSDNHDQTVVWLDEMQSFIEHDDASSFAESIHILLSKPASFLIIGTLWQQYWERYTDNTQLPSGDRRSKNRTILNSATIVNVPTEFSETERHDAYQAVGADLVWQQAIDAASDGRNIAQIMAGGPDLIDRFENATNSTGKAIICVAMDVVNLGHHQPIPETLLKDAIPDYLDMSQRVQFGEHWFEEALQYVTKKLKGAVSPLEPVRHAPGVGSPTGYRLADYLVQYGREHRKNTVVPQSLWDSLLAHVEPTINPDEPSGIDKVAHHAARRGLYFYATKLLEKLCNHLIESPYFWGPIEDLPRLLERAGYQDEANYWRMFSAHELYDIDAMVALTKQHEDAGNIESAARMLIELGACDIDDDTHDPLATQFLANLYFRNGQFVDGFLVVEDLLDRDNLEAIFNIADELEVNGDIYHARLILETAAEDASSDTATMLADFLRRIGELDEAESWSNFSVRSGNSFGMLIKSQISKQTGKPQEALAWTRRAAKLGNEHAIREYLQLLDSTEEKEGAQRWLPPVQETSFSALLPEGTLQDHSLTSNNEPIDPENPCNPRWEVLDCTIIEDLNTQVSSFVAAGNFADAEYMLRRAAIAETKEALPELRKLLSRMNRKEESERIYMYGLRPDGNTSDPW